VDLPSWRAAASARCASLLCAPHTTQTHRNRQTDKEGAWGRPRLLLLKQAKRQGWEFALTQGRLPHGCPHTLWEESKIRLKTDKMIYDLVIYELVLHPWVRDRFHKSCQGRERVARCRAALSLWSPFFPSLVLALGLFPFALFRNSFCSRVSWTPMCAVLPSPSKTPPWPPASTPSISVGATPCGSKLTVFPLSAEARQGWGWTS